MTKVETNSQAVRIARINKTLVDALEPGASRYIVWDSDLKGFGVRVETSGRKTYLVRYRAAGGGRRAPYRQLTVAAHGKLTPHEAREEARKVLARVVQGEDPVSDRQSRRKAANVAEMLSFYCEDYAMAAGLRAATIKDARSVFDKFVIPAIGAMKVEDVSKADVRRIHAEALRQAGRYRANRALGCLSSAFTRAIENGWRDDNPARGVKRFPEDECERYIDEAELARLFAALDGYEDQNAADAIRLMLFTGARVKEVLHAPWSQFDLDKGLWLKPSSHTKQKRQHRVELAGPALTILQGMRSRDPLGVWLFPGADRSKPRADLHRPWRQIRKRAELPDVQLKTMRHTCASYMLSEGATLAVVGKALGHTQPVTTARYAHLIENTQRVALEKAGNKMEALGRRASADVITLGKKGVA